MSAGLTVMSYNIHNGIGEDGVYDMERIARTIEDAGCDLVGLQELGIGWDADSRFEDELAYLADRLQMKSFAAPILDLDPPAGSTVRRRYGCAVLSRFELLDAHNHPLTRIHTYKQAEGPQRMPGFAEVVVEVSGRLVQFFCTHLYWLSQPIRLIEAQEMARQMQERAEHLEAVYPQMGAPCQVLVGDLNALPEDEEVLDLSRLFTDAWVTAGTGPGYTFPATGADRRIDFIFVNAQVQVTSSTVRQAPGSDHLPVVARLALP